MRFPVTSASLNQIEAAKPAAIVRPAEIKNCEFYEGKLKQCESDYDMWLDEFKTSGTWKEKYKSWQDCCDLYLGKTRRAIDKRIQKYKTGTEVPALSPSEDKKNTLSRISELAPKEEEREKPRVKTAQESIADKEPVEEDGPPVHSGRMVCPLCHGGGHIGPKPKDIKEPCKCGECELTQSMSDVLWRAGVPCKGLSMKEGGLIISKLSKNEWRLPAYWSYLKNKGEWKEREWLGKPAPKH